MYFYRFEGTDLDKYKRKMSGDYFSAVIAQFPEILFREEVARRLNGNSTTAHAQYMRSSVYIFLITLFYWSDLIATGNT